MTDIAKKLTLLQKDIQEAETAFGRKKGAVLLLAISKKQPLQKIIEAADAGQRAFGENYLQEALPKIAALLDRKLEWHFVGPIQSNKTKKIAEQFDWVHSVSDLRIAKRLNEQRPPERPPLNICLEINVSHETSKSGIDFDSAQEIAEECRLLSRLKLRGLMAIPAPQKHFIDQRAECYKLRLLFESLTRAGIPLDTLSMGMSQDMRAAIAEHATIVRIGTALFGSRLP